MQHESPLLLALVALQALRIIGGAQCCRYERLRLPTRKQRGPVHPRKNADLDIDLANLIKRPVIRPNAFLQHLLAKDVLPQQLVVLPELLCSRRIALRQLFLQLILDPLHQRIALKLRVLLRIESIFQPIANLGLQRSEILLIHLNLTRNSLRLPSPAHQVLDRRADLLDLAVRELDGINHLLLGNFLRPRFDHDDTVLRAHDHDVQQAHRPLRIGRIDDHLTVHNPDPHRAHWPVKWDIA